MTETDSRTSPLLEYFESLISESNKIDIMINLNEYVRDKVDEYHLTMSRLTAIKTLCPNSGYLDKDLFRKAAKYSMMNNILRGV